jgi:hypothetical protein
VLPSGQQCRPVRRERAEPRQRAVVLLAVPAGEHLGGEQLVLPRAAQQHRHVAVVEAVDEHDDPQGHVLRGHRVHPGQADERDAVEQCAVPARVHLSQVLEQGGEVVQRRVVPFTGDTSDDLVREAVGIGDDRAVPVVLAVDAQHLEAGGERLDLAQEVVGREPPLAQRSGQRVGRRRECHAAVGELAQQTRHQHGVARVVELELVDAHQLARRERLDGGEEPERADEVRVLDERAVRRVADGVREGREQVRLAHAETTVEVDRDRFAFAPTPEAGAAARLDLTSGPAQPVDRRRLGRVRGIRDVGVERSVREVARWDELGQQAVRGHARAAADEGAAHCLLRVRNGWWRGFAPGVHDGPAYVASRHPRRAREGRHTVPRSTPDDGESTCRPRRLTMREDVPPSA